MPIHFHFDLDDRLCVSIGAIEDGHIYLIIELFGLAGILCVEIGATEDGQGLVKVHQPHQTLPPF